MVDLPNSTDRLSLSPSLRGGDVSLGRQPNSGFHCSAFDCFSSVFSLWLLHVFQARLWKRFVLRETHSCHLWTVGWFFFCFHLFQAIIAPFISVGSGSLSGLNSGVLDLLLYLCVWAMKQAESTDRITVRVLLFHIYVCLKHNICLYTLSLSGGKLASPYFIIFFS